MKPAKPNIPKTTSAKKVVTPKNPSLYEDIFKKSPYELRQAVGKSKKWYQDQIQKLSKVRAIPLILSSTSRHKISITPGKLYLFGYHAKTKNLPYWDAFPLVFPFRKTDNGFIGLNMHYLPYKERVFLLTNLNSFRSNNDYNQYTRLKFSWAMISSMSRFRTAKPCVHRYLTTQIQTPLLAIDSEDWATAMLLPVEKFYGAKTVEVWAESKKRSRKSKSIINRALSKVKSIF